MPALDLIAPVAFMALEDEVRTSPKPGLVTPFHNGAHDDMDFDVFMKSAHALTPYFDCCAREGHQWEAEAGPALLEALRPHGLHAEKTMLEATHGVNTHKGLIFSLGLLCAAAGNSLRHSLRPGSAVTLLQLCKAMAADHAPRHFAQVRASGQACTAGERLFLQSGVTGVRGQAASGFSAVAEGALPRLRRDLEAGLNLNDASVNALLTLMLVVEDTNVLHRSGPEGLTFMRRAAQDALEAGGAGSMQGHKKVLEAGEAFCARQLSPGGCADLLAITLFLHHLEISGAEATHMSRFQAHKQEKEVLR